MELMTDDGYTFTPYGEAQSAELRKTKVKAARVGERVRIINPRVFVRCGYPLCAPDVRLLHRKEIDALVDAAAKAMGATLSVSDGSMNHHVRKYLESAAVSLIIRREKFGGNDRSIYDAAWDGVPIKDKIAVVKSKKMKQTGTYMRGHYHHSMDGPDWEPPYLTDVVTHCIYTVEIEDGKPAWPIQIDAVHCERVGLNP